MPHSVALSSRSGWSSSQQLHERAAQRHAHHVRPLDPEGVEHGDGVVGEGPDRVGPLGEGTGGPAGVAVVVADHAVVLRQPHDQLVGHPRPLALAPMINSIGGRSSAPAVCTQSR